MLTDADYIKWKTAMLSNKNPDLVCLESFVFVTKQYLLSPSSIACK
jgi:hypothetical protein